MLCTPEVAISNSGKAPTESRRTIFQTQIDQLMIITYAQHAGKSHHLLLALGLDSFVDDDLVWILLLVLHPYKSANILYLLS